MTQSSPSEEVPLALDGVSGWRNVPDAALIHAMVQRHQHAFAEVHRRHADAVMHFVRRLKWTAAFEQDVVQEVFLRLWQAPANFDAARGSLRTYLFALARGRAVDHIRSDGSRRSREAQDAFLRSGETEAEVVALAGMDQELLRRLLQDLPEDERAPIVLAFYDGLNYRAVAERLGVPEGTTKSRIRRGLRRLRHQIETARTGSSTDG